ncbi:MAG: 9-O-acetyl-N-acetylneuraminate esterase, partial [Pseudobutyrivibrio sp.]|nr:9-O-acetyl-N-acetylneuraminate esterase [Pseudobutyrivibrio sp.]
MKSFNTTAVCIPAKHYMVDITDKVKQIKELIDAGKYFTINRARQYGKTTTLNILNDFLKTSYDVISIDFQDVTAAIFESEDSLVKG